MNWWFYLEKLKFPVNWKLSLKWFLPAEVNDLFCWAMVVAQLVEWSLPTQEIHSLNPGISKNLSTNCTIKNREDENKGKEARNGPSFKKWSVIRDLTTKTEPVASSAVSSWKWTILFKVPSTTTTLETTKNFRLRGTHFFPNFFVDLIGGKIWHQS